MANKKHAALIREWLNGAKIQWRHNGTPWRDCDDDNPEWSPVIEYRIKPAEPEREYPKTQMTGDEIEKFFEDTPEGSFQGAFIATVNEAIKRLCDNGQIITLAEFDRAVVDGKALAFNFGLFVARKFAERPVAELEVLVALERFK